MVCMHTWPLHFTFTFLAIWLLGVSAQFSETHKMLSNGTKFLLPCPTLDYVHYAD